MGFARVSSNLILVGVLLIASILFNSTNIRLSYPMGFARMSSNLILVGVLLIASIFLNSTTIQLSPVTIMTRWPSG